MSVVQEEQTRRDQLKYVTTLAEIIDFAKLENTELFFINDPDCSSVKLASGGIVVDKKLYKLPHTAAIAYSKSHHAFQESNDGWKLWSIHLNESEITLEELREQLLDEKINKGIVIHD